MTINFYVGFRSQPGQSVALKPVCFNKQNEIRAIEIPLLYLNEAYWHLPLDTDELELSDEFEYSYIYRDLNRGEEIEFCKRSSLNTKKLDVKQLDVVDDWRDDSLFEDVFSSKPFVTVLNQGKEKVKVTDTKKPTHIFQVKTPALAPGKVLCVTGAGKKLKDWDSSKPLLMEFRKNQWLLRLNLAKEAFPLEYKLGIYDISSKEMDFEDGPNRQIPEPGAKAALMLLHQVYNPVKHRWRGAGVNIPVSSLRTANSWGVGDFTDLNQLTDFSREAGISLVQLLPINDTTSTHTNKDSYPYSAVSAFALHPIYLNVQKLAVAAGHNFPDDMQVRIRELNSKKSLHYQEVLALKNAAIRELYTKDKNEFKDDFGWFSFFDLNRHWLVPYAAYCYLREKNKTADYNTWGEYMSFQEDMIQELVSPENDFYDEVAIHYFTQYHLHLQLKDAVDYAHKSGVILKGDLPIGVGRHSADAWMYRPLFHMDMQAGAPPDAFATKGQNWSFPTYNWEKMAEDNYAWWRQRMEHMSNYFDAIRIDHVLGFFRIWSIPLDAIEGILGRFVPAWPLRNYDFYNAGVHFNEERYCSPFVNEDLLRKWFGQNAELAKDIFFNDYRFKPEYNTQRKVAAYMKEHPEHGQMQRGLCELLANVIAFKDDALASHYHLRINMFDTDSFRALSHFEQGVLNGLFDDYFFHKQNVLWEEEGIKKLAALTRSTDMLICAEDLGMVPKMVESVLNNMQMLSLEVQRMPKKPGEIFSNPHHATYLSVVTPSTHDMASVREWWEEDRKVTQDFYNQQLRHYGEAPYFAEPWICRDIVQQHLASPAMWAVFLLQDLLCMDGSLRIDDPKAERINNPPDPDHYWNYRMHISLEHLLEQTGFIVTLKTMIRDTGR